MKYMYLLLFIFLIFYSFNIIKMDEIITLKKGNFLSIDDKINDKNVNLWIRNISSINNNPIYIYIDSPGGSVDSGLKLINTFKYYQSLNKSFDCIAQNAYSMAFYIFQNCDRRFITQSSTLMQHQISLGNAKGQLKNLNNYINLINDISENLDEFTFNRLNITREEYQLKVLTDWWLYGDNILKYNAADSYVLIGCDKDLYDKKIPYEESTLSIDEEGMLEVKTIQKYKDLCPL